jgi:hypothetical protein
MTKSRPPYVRPADRSIVRGVRRQGPRFGRAALAVAVLALLFGSTAASSSAQSPGGSTKTPSRYAVTVAPWLQVGQVGWCASVTIGSPRKAVPAGTSCAFAAGSDRHMISWGSSTATTSQGGYSFAVVDNQVARVVLSGGKALVPRAAPSLPNGWKTVLLKPTERATGVRLRAANGTPLASVGSGFVWPQPSVASDQGTPAGSPCAIDDAGAADPRGSFVIEHVQSTFDLNGRGFLACAQTNFRVDNQWEAATVLVDATAPGTLPADLAGATPLAGHPGVFELTAASPPGSPAIGSSAFARRDGNAWLVVSGSAQSRAARADLLTQISASTVLP